MNLKEKFYCYINKKKSLVTWQQHKLNKSKQKDIFLNNINISREFVFSPRYLQRLHGEHVTKCRSQFSCCYLYTVSSQFVAKKVNYNPKNLTYRNCFSWFLQNDLNTIFTSETLFHLFTLDLPSNTLLFHRNQKHSF